MRRLYAAALVGAVFLCPLSAFAGPLHIGCAEGTLGPAGALTSSLEQGGYKPLITTQETKDIAGIFYVSPDGKWVEIWMKGKTACLVDAGDGWVTVGAGAKEPESAAPAPQIKPAPAVPGTNPNDGPSVDENGSLSL